MTAVTEKMELKPCPFCDGAPRLVEPHESDRSIEGETDDEEWLSFIECDCVDMFFVKGSATSQDEARQSVVTAWNRRPALSAAQAQPVAYNDAHRHAVALRQCALFAADVGEHIVKAMTEAADFLDAPRSAAITAEAQALQAAADANGGYINGKTKAIVLAALRAVSPPAVPGEVHAQLALIKHLAEYTTEKNWADKRLYIMQAVDRALSPPSTAIAGGGGLNPSPAQAMPDDTHLCPICAEPFKPDDLCASDITEGTCHAACLEGSPVVDLETGEEIPDAKIDTYLFSEVAAPSASSKEESGE